MDVRNSSKMCKNEWIADRIKFDCYPYELVAMDGRGEGLNHVMVKFRLALLFCLLKRSLHI